MALGETKNEVPQPAKNNKNVNEVTLAIIFWLAREQNYDWEYEKVS